MPLTLADLEGAVEGAAVSAIQTLLAQTFGPTVSSTGVKLMQDIIAVAAKPSLKDALADLPDVLAAVEAIDAAPATVQPATVQPESRSNEPEGQQPPGP